MILRLFPKGLWLKGNYLKDLRLGDHSFHGKGFIDDYLAHIVLRRLCAVLIFLGSVQGVPDVLWVDGDNDAPCRGLIPFQAPAVC